MGELGSDVKTNNASSALSAGSSGSQEGQSNNSATKSDALEASSTSSSSKAGDKPIESMADFVKQQITKKHGSSKADGSEDGEGNGEGDGEEEKLDSIIETDEEKKEGEESEDKEENSDNAEGDEKKDGEGEGDGDGDKDEEEEAGEGNESKTEGEEKLDPTKPVPYKRFQEVIQQKNETQKKLDVAIAKSTNFDTIQSFCNQNNIQPAEFQESLRIQSLISTGNYPAALEALKGVVSQLEGVTGDVLPADLQSEVTDGTISESRAKELARLRAQTKLSERSAKQQQLIQQRQQQEQFQRSLDVSANNWATTKLTSDPDFKPKKAENAVDGKYEEVQDKFTALLNKVVDGKYVNVVNSPEELVSLLDRAYTIVNAKYTNASKKKSPTGKRLVSSASGSSTISKQPKKIEEAGSMAEAIQISLNNRR